tara:strand:+ start:5069 stop:5425 length:357 start_codon:yes stop_codon:yes gene_type:complete
LSDKIKLLKTLKSRGIVAPKGAKVNDLKHMVEHWLSGSGFLLRLALPPSRKPDNPANLMQFDTLYWIPDSRFGRLIAESQLVLIMGRADQPPEGSVVLDVPKDFNDRWGVGVTDGSNN